MVTVERAGVFLSLLNHFFPDRCYLGQSPLFVCKRPMDSQWISRKVFWLNIVWLFFMSLFPVATGWISADPFSRAAAYFYFLIFAVWGVTFYIMVAVLARDNPRRSPKIMLMLKPQRWLFELFSLITGLILIYWLPITSLLILGINIIFWILFPPKDSDQIADWKDSHES